MSSFDVLNEVDVFIIPDEYLLLNTFLCLDCDIVPLSLARLESFQSIYHIVSNKKESEMSVDYVLPIMACLLALP